MHAISQARFLFCGLMNFLLTCYCLSVRLVECRSMALIKSLIANVLQVCIIFLQKNRDNI